MAPLGAQVEDLVLGTERKALLLLEAVPVVSRAGQTVSGGRAAAGEARRMAALAKVRW